MSLFLKKSHSYLRNYNNGYKIGSIVGFATALSAIYKEDYKNNKDKYYAPLMYSSAGILYGGLFGHMFGPYPFCILVGIAVIGFKLNKINKI